MKTQLHQDTQTGAEAATQASKMPPGRVLLVSLGKIPGHMQVEYQPRD
jgi:hypothetical protein